MTDKEVREFFGQAAGDVPAGGRGARQPDAFPAEALGAEGRRGTTRHSLASQATGRASSGSTPSPTRRKSPAPGTSSTFLAPGNFSHVEGAADRRGLALLPEIHATYAERIHEALADKGFMTYDFFLPGLLIDALDRGDGSVLKRWINELTDKKIRSVNMLGCHDGIPLLDLKGPGSRTRLSRSSPPSRPEAVALRISTG